MNKHFDVIVIGGGASGMMAAGRAAERGRQVLLLEKNKELGKKLAITGGSRCNICNNEEDEHLLLQYFCSAEKFLYSSFSQFGLTETKEFFTSHDLPLVVEANKRVFPASKKASDVVAVMEKYVRSGGVEILTNATVKKIVVDGEKITGVRVGNEILTAESFIIATGGKSHPETGSTGDGFSWLKELGCKVVKPTPSVVPLAVQDDWIKMLAGVSFDHVKVTFFVEGRKQLAVQGRVLCTHFGISGPLILNTASKVADMLLDGVVTATIDVFPGMDLGALDKHITKIFDDNKNRDLKNVMKLIAPTGTASAILMLLPRFDVEKKVHSISKQERKTIVNLLKDLPLTITGLMGNDRAVVSDGGISISEIDGKTMRSRKYENLYITGDLLHINRPSGGFSLQLCWTTGWVAGDYA